MPSFNTIAYIIYGLTIVYITIIVGYKFHKNGIHFISLYQPNLEIAHAINNLLLVLYYCLNIGYSVAVIYFWEDLNSFIELINSLGRHIGTIVIGLGLIHYLNITWIYLIYRYNKYSLENN